MQDREGTKITTLKGRERGWKDKVQACWLSYDWSQFPACMPIRDLWSKQWFFWAGRRKKWQRSQSRCGEADTGGGMRGEAALLRKAWWELGTKGRNITTCGKKPHTVPSWLWLLRKQPMTWLEPEIQKLIKGFADERGEAGERSRSGVYQHHRPALTHREDPVHVLVHLGGWRGGGLLYWS